MNCRKISRSDLVTQFAQLSKMGRASFDIYFCERRGLSSICEIYCVKPSSGDKQLFQLGNTGAGTALSRSLRRHRF